jgi:hypothetical protein
MVATILVLWSGNIILDNSRLVLRDALQSTSEIELAPNAQSSALGKISKAIESCVSIFFPRPMRPVKRSRAKGVGVEAELGCLEGVEEGVNVDEGSAFLTDPKEAANCVQIARSAQGLSFQIFDTYVLS